MSTMTSEVYDALLFAGAPEEKAKQAAEAIAGHENRFARIENDLNPVKWMIGFNPSLGMARVRPRSY